MQKLIFLLAASAVALTSNAGAGKPGPSPTASQEVFWRAAKGSGTQLLATARDGSNASTLYTDTGSQFFRFDVGSADSGLIAIGSATGQLKLISYGRNSAGVFAPLTVTTLLSGVPNSTEVDLSPDGTRIAYRGAGEGSLMVYDIASGTSEMWSSGLFAWDFAWIRGGASIALAEHSNPIDLRGHLYEVAGPGQRVELLNVRNIDAVDVARTDNSLLVLSYNSEDGKALVGSWRLPTTAADGSTTAGAWLNTNIPGRDPAFKGTWSCDDHYLIFLGSGPAGQQIWFTKDMPSGPDQVLAKAANAVPQSWSRCPTPASAATSAFDFRVVGQ